MASSFEVGSQNPPAHMEQRNIERHTNETPTPSAESAGNQRQERMQGSRRGGRPGRGGRGGTYDRQSRRPPNSRPPGSGSKPNPSTPLHGDVEGRQVENTAAGVSSTQHEQEETEDGSEPEVCFICASPIVHHAVTPCNHRTCHICALRLRALYKTKACAHCRVS